MPKQATKKNTTVIYITSNTEDTKFENKIKKELQKACGDLPIISVSRKPTKFEKNISVGDVPLCNSTTLKQILTGLEAAKTEYAILAKDDCIYPPEYFKAAPATDDHIYSYTNMWVLGDKFWQKKISDYAQFANRKYWISQIKSALKDQKDWEPIAVPVILDTSLEALLTLEPAPLNFRSTGEGRRFPQVKRNTFPKRALAYWGAAAELKNKMGA